MNTIKAVVLVCFLGLLSGCCTIKVPVETEKSKRDIATKLAADIKELQASGNLEVSYKSEIETSYAKLDQDTIALHMWLQAARCESEKGNDKLAAQVYQYAYETYNKRNTPNPLPSAFDLTRTETPGMRLPSANELKAVTDQLAITLATIQKSKR